LIHVPFRGPVPEDASRESPVHKAIYQATSAGAIVHAHPPHAIALSYLCDEVKPLDLEGQVLCPRIPVVEGGSGTPNLSRAVAQALQTAPVVIVRGHGSFATGHTLDEAGILTSAVEHACHILILLRQVNPVDDASYRPS
jgi:Ribulose-5-phosphate 4-epimerase and related epimerases and aldolases